jgi:hypothetical protein
MSIFTIEQCFLGTLHSPGYRSMGESEHAWRRPVSRRLRLLLRLGIGLLITAWLLCVAWVEPVVSGYLGGKR